MVGFPTTIEPKTNEWLEFLVRQLHVMRFRQWTLDMQ